MIQLAGVVRPVGGALPTGGGGSGSVSLGGSGSGRTAPGGMSMIAERARVWCTRKGTGGRERVGVTGGWWGSKLGRFGVARHWCL